MMQSSIRQSRRASYALLGLLALGGMGAAAWLLVGPHLRRETVTIVSLFPSRHEETKAIIGGICLALDEELHRAGKFKVRHENWGEGIGGGNTVFKQANERADILALIAAHDNESTRILLERVRHSNASLLVISPAATRADLTPSYAPCFFRTIPTDRVHGALAARWAKRSGLKRLHIYYDARIPSSITQDTLREEARRQGLEVTESAEADPSAMSRVQTRASPDLLFIDVILPEFAADVIGCLRRAGCRGKILLGTRLHPSSLMLKAPDDIYVIDSPAPPPAEFQRRAGTPDPYAYYGYLAARAAIEAIAKADSKDRTAVIRACSQLPTFDPEGEIADPAIGLSEIKGGRLELVEVLR